MGTQIWLCTYWLIYFFFWYVSPVSYFLIIYQKHILIRFSCSWRREWLPTPVFWPREFHGLYSPWGHKESDTIERLSLSLSFLLAMCCVLCLVTQSCLTLCDSMDCNPPGSSVHGDSPGKNTGVDWHGLFQVIFPTQGSNPGLPHCRRILYRLSQRGSRRILEWVAYSFSRGTSHLKNWSGVSCNAGGFFTSSATREALC